MWRKLIWKEWCEQRWRLAFGCVLFGGFTLIGLSTRMMEDEMVIAFGLIFGAPLMVLLTSMAPLAGEREEGTMAVLVALPLRPWKILLVKTLMAVAVCLAPLVVILAVTLAVAGDRELTFRRILEFHALSMGFSAMLLVWSLAFGARMATEARAALVTLAVAAFWCISFMALGMSLDIVRRDGNHEALLALGSLHPMGGIREGPFRACPTWLWAVVQSAIMAGLWLWTARRWTRLGGRAA
ncbi:MAG: ABC transporter permease subunit [Planctomycetes bacterium]|nr:ABC transporter permease subunit [Planctomycetota bacterium]